MHASLHKSRRENHRRVVFTQQDTIYSRAHLVLTNLLITSLLVLCFSRWFLLFLPPNILLISCHPRLLFWYLLFRYRWAHHLCFLSMNDLSRSSFFDLSLFIPWHFIPLHTMPRHTIPTCPNAVASLAKRELPGRRFLAIVDVRTIYRDHAKHAWHRKWCLN